MRALQRRDVGLKVGLGVLLVVVAFSLIWGLCGPSASAVTGAHITGQVTSAATGSPVYAEVVAFAETASGWQFSGVVNTDLTGYYDLGGLAAGTYVVSVAAPTYAQQCYNGKATRELADRVTVAEGETKSNINVSLIAASHIKGRITDAATGDPGGEGEHWATAYIQNGSAWEYASASGTNASGDYDIGELAPGTYIVEFTCYSGYHVPQYYSGKLTEASANTFTVGAAEVKTGIDAAMTPAAHITGYLTDAVTEGPLFVPGKSYATAYIQNGSTWEYAGEAVTDESGYYDINGLLAGTYRVGFGAGSGYESVFYNGKTTLDSADPVTLAESATRSGINGTVFVGSHIQGRLTDAATGNPLNGSVTEGYATAYLQTGAAWYEAGLSRVNASGDYNIGGLAGGIYHVGFMAVSGYETQSYVEYYNGKTTQASAANLTLGSDENKTGINAVVSSVAPTITSLSPTSGPTAGGNIVTINGTGFSGATTVKFGGTPATAVTWVSRYRLTAKAPAHAVGKVDVTATNPIGTSSIAGTANDYTYFLRTEEASTNLRFAGSWTSSAGASYSGGSYKKSATAGGAVAIKFTGNYLAWIANKTSSMGIARVTLDYGTPVEVDLYKSTTAYQQKVWATPATLASGTHTLIIEWTGKKNAASTGTYINVDAFDTLGSLYVAPLRYQENNAKVIYSTGWTSAASNWASAGSYRYASTTNAKVTVKFTGTSITWVGVKAANYGKAKVTLDGVYKGTIDLYSASTKWGAKLYSVTVPSGNHTLVITCTGTKQTAATGTRVSADAFDVLGTLY